MNRSTMRPLALTCCALFAPAALADDLYFAEIAPGLVTGHLSRIKTDGTGYTQFLEVGGGLRSIAVDRVDRKIYWTDVNNYMIARANMDGSGAEAVVTSGLIFPAAITIDPEARTMYWLDQDNWLATSNLDGSNFNVISETVTHRGVALDTAAGKVYWSTSDTMFKGKVLRANLNGSGVQIVITSGESEFKPSAIALDLPGGKIYWTDYTVDVVRRADLNGTNQEIIWAAGANHNPRGIVLDLAHGKVYWGQDNDFEGSSSRIMRANLDGTDAEVVIDGIGWPNYLALVPCRADYNGDGFVDGIDSDMFENDFAAGNIAADYNGDGFVDGIDSDQFNNDFAAGC